MNRISVVVFLFSVLVVVSGCVEVRDKSQQEAEVVVKELRNVTIDEPYYLIAGELVSKRHLDSNTRVASSQEKTGLRVQYELNFDHLSFREGGVIYTMGYDVVFNIADLDSRQAAIQTFPNDHEAIQGQNGVSGGLIKLNVEHARGDLTLKMIGERGGKGARGDNPDPNKAVGYVYNMVCIAQEVGNKGYKGARGGNSGKAEVIVRDNAGFDFSMQIERGQGGSGGDGGTGPIACGYLQLDSGPVGDKGADGDLGEICVTLGENKRQCQ